VTDNQQVEGLRVISPKASLRHDGPVECVLLPEVALATPTGTRVMDVVLCPRGLGSYTTRLLLAEKVPERSNLNWQVVTLLGNTWQTWSWNQISQQQPWLRIYAEHARCLK